MSDKRQYNSKMNAKGLEASVSEEQARHMATHQGTTYVFLVQAHAGPKIVNEDGSEVVSLIPDLVELVPDAHAERIRELQRALYLARPDQFGQKAFETGETGPTVDDAAASVDAVIERDEDGNPVGIWDGTEGSPGTSESNVVDGPWPGDTDYPAQETAEPPKKPRGKAAFSDA